MPIEKLKRDYTRTGVAGSRNEPTVTRSDPTYDLLRGLPRATRDRVKEMIDAAKARQPANSGGPKYDTPPPKNKFEMATENRVPTKTSQPAFKAASTAVAAELPSAAKTIKETPVVQAANASPQKEGSGYVPPPASTRGQRFAEKAFSFAQGKIGTPGFEKARDNTPYTPKDTSGWAGVGQRYAEDHGVATPAVEAARSTQTPPVAAKPLVGEMKVSHASTLSNNKLGAPASIVPTSPAGVPAAKEAQKAEVSKTTAKANRYMEMAMSGDKAIDEYIQKMSPGDRPIEEIRGTPMPRNKFGGIETKGLGEYINKNPSKRTYVNPHSMKRYGSKLGAAMGIGKELPTTVYGMDQARQLELEKQALINKGDVDVADIRKAASDYSSDQALSGRMTDYNMPGIDNEGGVAGGDFTDADIQKGVAELQGATSRAAQDAIIKRILKENPDLYLEIEKLL